MLQSAFFKSDSKLEACLIRDSAHITEGAAGDHVSRIQAALVRLDGLLIEASEVRAKLYGPSTAAAVLRFKRKRNIVNRSYQTQADNIVGKMTIGQLDRELFQLEHGRLGAVGCVIVQRTDYLRCNSIPSFDPNLQVGVLLSALAVTVAGAATAAPTEGQIMQKAFDDSRQSLRQAIKRLDDLIAAVNNAKGKPLDAPTLLTLLAVVKWLNVDSKNPSSAITTVQSARLLLNNNLNLKTSTNTDPPLKRGGAVGVLDSQGNVVHTTKYHAHTPGGPDTGMECGDDFFDVDGPRCRRDVVTHEFFHMLGIHHGGGATNGPTIRANIKTSVQALDSADNLAQLVAQLTTMGGRTDACTRKHE